MGSAISRSGASVRPLGVLVVSGGGFSGQAAITMLRESSAVRVIVADCHADSIGRHLADAYHQVPAVRESEPFLAALESISALEGARLILPATDHELECLSAARERFERRGITVAIPDHGLTRLFRRKGELYRHLSDHGFPTLPIADPDGGDCEFPVIGKPAVGGWGSRDLVVVASFEEYSRGGWQRSNRVWQRYLKDPDEVSVDFAVDFAGRVSRLGLRRRVQISGGFAVISEDVQSPKLERIVRDLIAHFGPQGLRGAMNVQLLREGSEAYISDVNPRHGTSVVHWQGSGLNPLLFLCEGLAEPTGASAAKPGRSVRFLQQLRLPSRGGAAGSRSVDGVVFDLDDTLIPHKPWLLEKLRLLALAQPGALPDGFLAEAAQLVEEGGAARLFDELGARWALERDEIDALIEAYRRQEPQSCRVFPDVLGTLQTLKARGLSLGLLTDNPEATQRSKLSSSGLAGWFDAIVFSHSTGVEKPATRPFIEIAERLAIAPGRLAMVGDNPYRDMSGAIESGYGRTLWVRREGGLHSFDPEIYFGLPGRRSGITVIDGLAGLGELLAS